MKRSNVKRRNIVFDLTGLYIVAKFFRNLCTGDPCEGMRSLPLQTENPMYGPVYAIGSPQAVGRS